MSVPLRQCFLTNGHTIVTAILRSVRPQNCIPIHRHTTRHVPPSSWHLWSLLLESALQYLIYTPNKLLLFKRGGNLTMEAYTYVDFASFVSDRRSTSGYCTFLCREPCCLVKEVERKHISIAHNQHDKTKHIEIDRHFIKEKFDNGLIATT
ncbi:hypothetical protein MTR_2g081480 [Medicago truncatula]|uniref:Uncharacterized protein n=1 Tax=Medicago truncatula TaxID=3880 RepID=G7ITJ9_MEDTR|nr:hypothetical protein MTR_2g081480 [Medicago truncatula]